MNTPIYPVSPTPEQAQALRSHLRRRANKAGGILLLFFVLSNLVSIPFLLLMRYGVSGRIGGELYSSLITLGSYTVQYLLVVPFLLWLNNRKTEDTLSRQLVRPQVSGGFLAKWTLIGFGCSYAVNYLFNFFFLFLQQLTGVELQAPNLVSQATLLDNIITVVFFALVAPLMEEFLFRGGILSDLKPYGNGFAVLATGFLFGLTHMNYQQIFYAAAMGIVAGFICVRARSLWPGVLLHFSLNLIGAIQSVLLGRVDPQALNALMQGGGRASAALAGSILPLLGVVLLALLCMGLCVAGVVVLLVELSKGKAAVALEQNGVCLPLSQKLAAFFTAPLMLLFLAVAAGMTILNALGIG